MRILVTGGTGFVGRHTVTALAESGHEPVIIARQDRRTQKDQRYVQLDLLHEDAIGPILRRERPTHLIHLAWETTHGRYWSAPENRAWSAATRRLFHEFFEAGGDRLVATGTCAEYDWNSLGRSEADEVTSKLGGASEYAQGKLAAFEASEALRDSGASLAWCRLFFPYGRFEDPARFIPSITKALLSGNPADMTNGHQARDFLDARDVGEALVRVLLSDVTGPVNIASGTGTRLIDIATEISGRLGCEHLLRPGVIPTRPADPPYLVGTNHRLTQEVGFRPRIPLSEGLLDAIAHWRDALRAAGG